MKPENNRILNFLCSNPWLGSTTVVTKDLREIMLSTDGSIMAQGKLFNIKGTPLGAGVYKVSLELANP